MLTSITPSKQMIRKFPPPCSVSLVVLPPHRCGSGSRASCLSVFTSSHPGPDASCSEPESLRVQGRYRVLNRCVCLYHKPGSLFSPAERREAEKAHNKNNSDNDNNSPANVESWLKKDVSP